MNLRRFFPLLVIALFATATAANAAVHKVSPGESIQDAIDMASPGDTILVEPGTYVETGNSLYGLHITTDDLRLIAKKTKKAKKTKHSKKGKSKAKKSKRSDNGKSKSKKSKKGAGPTVRILHHGTQETGVYAAPPGCGYRDSACAGELQGFYLRGFIVEGFPQNGIQTRWVDGFEFIRNESVNNLNNGIYPTLSANGLVQENVSYGSLDTAMWVAGSEHVRVIGNEVYGSPIGYEITVSNDVYSADNDIHDNTVGVGLFHPNAAGNPPLDVMADWVFENNHVYDNNLPNPAPPGSFQAGVPPGAGFLILGVDGHVIRNNRVENNGTFGIAVSGWCSAVSLGDPSRNCANDPPDPSDDPSANNNLIEDNELVDNGLDPDPLTLAFLAADLTYLHLIEANGVGNCFVDNVFDTHTAIPGPALPVDGCCL